MTEFLIVAWKVFVYFSAALLCYLVLRWAVWLIMTTVYFISVVVASPFRFVTRTMVPKRICPTPDFLLSRVYKIQRTQLPDNEVI